MRESQKTKRFRAAVVLACACAAAWSLACGSAPGARAQGIETLLEDAVESHDRVLGAKADLEAARRRAREALGDWFPTLDTTGAYGWEHQKKHEADTTSTAFESLDVKLSQLLWDFGKTNANARKAALEVTKAELTLTQTTREIILEAVKAYANLLRAHEVLGFANQSRDNILRQTGLEEARVETGAGLSTDVLQAKTQLAGAEARVIQAEGTLVSAENRFQAVYRFLPNDVSTLAHIRIPSDRLPATLDDAVALALDDNTRLESARIDERITRQEIRAVTGGEFAPRIEGVLQRKWQNNVAGTLEFKGESLAKVEVTMPFNLGLTSIDTLEAAKADYLSKSRTTADLTRTVTEEVRNAWSSLRTAQRNAQSLQNQADIAAAFLELARQEQQLGQRSLIDVLTGETSLINALSDAASAKVDALIAAFDLLNATGQLDIDVFTVAAPPPSGTPSNGTDPEGRIEDAPN